MPCAAKAQETDMQIRVLWAALLLLLTFVAVLPAHATAPTGAIFTTLSDGTEVNLNIFPAKEAVYLDGGPGPGAPQSAAGLDDATYVFQVTDPSGQTLLSTDVAGCRQFTVSGGVIVNVTPSGGCAHLTGDDVDHSAKTVQLMPYLDTPNNGGVYKAWVTKVEDYLAGCAANGFATGLSVVDCGYTPGNFHGFIPSDSKTDNYKIRTGLNAEIDTQFFNSSGQQLNGMGVKWVDTLGVSNRKWSYVVYWNSVSVAHVEAPEDGTHQIQISNQTGCTVGRVKLNGKYLKKTGPQNVLVRINGGTKKNGIYDYTASVEVQCLE
jgi:hypothetical protein